ncbi:hypothetical protein AABB24_027842 [Solanum stoloniferum]|uniref:Uncharacterized protein n=1 Tax=Solanum stoloniferum TaxID=62892 RepID=A0ABD2S407_9SOLN
MSSVVSDPKQQDSMHFLLRKQKGVKMKRVTKAQTYHIGSYQNQQRAELTTNIINLRQIKEMTSCLPCYGQRLEPNELRTTSPPQRNSDEPKPEAGEGKDLNKNLGSQSLWFTSSCLKLIDSQSFLAPFFQFFCLLIFLPTLFSKDPLFACEMYLVYFKYSSSSLYLLKISTFSLP